MKNLLTPTGANRFHASFHRGLMPYPLDFAFQRISGLSRELRVQSITQGGDNIGSTHLPEHIEHGRLTLERGVMLTTPLALTFDEVMRDFRASYLTVVVILLNEIQLPVCSWTFTDALPVSWKTGDLDANGNGVLINTLELAYREMSWLGVKA